MVCVSFATFPSLRTLTCPLFGPSCLRTATKKDIESTTEDDSEGNRSSDDESTPPPARRRQRTSPARGKGVEPAPPVPVPPQQQMARPRRDVGLPLRYIEK